MPEDKEKFSYKCDECDKIFVGLKAYYIWKHKQQNKTRKGFCSKECSRINNTRNRVIKKCLTCNNNFESLESRNSKFCSQRCSAIYNNAKRNIEKKEKCTEDKIKNVIENAISFVKIINCEFCNKEIKDSNNRRFCSHGCQHKFEYEKYIKDWKDGNNDGGSLKTSAEVSKHVRKYIFNKYENKCAECGWNKVNQYSKRLTLQIEHKDGNPYRHKEENLILLCPNCHSLTATFGGLNKGHGRKYRRR